MYYQEQSKNHIDLGSNARARVEITLGCNHPAPECWEDWERQHMQSHEYTLVCVSVPSPFLVLFKPEPLSFRHHTVSPGAWEAQSCRKLCVLVSLDIVATTVMIGPGTWCLFTINYCSAEQASSFSRHLLLRSSTKGTSGCLGSYVTPSFWPWCLPYAWQHHDI